MATRLQVNVQRSPARLRFGLFNCENFGVFDAFVGMESFPHDFPIIHQHRAYIRIGRGQGKAFLRYLQCPLQIFQIGFRCGVH
jgi:hypothetical protein